MNNNQNHVSHSGSSSIVLIFTVLSLVSFAVLALINSKADFSLSDSLSSRQRAYYEACHKGNAFYAAVSSGYDDGMADDIMSESIPINDNQSLDIDVKVNSTNSTDNSDISAVITRWQIVNHAEFDYDNTLPVIK